MLRIAVINGQNHKGSTYNIGKLLTDGISGDKEVSEFFLPRDLEHFCLGCYSCVNDETKCPFYAEKRRIMDAVDAADILVFTTPNYCMAPSAPMKAFIDLTFTYWFSHKPRACMMKKRAVVISTTAGAGAGLAIKPVARTLFYWGVPWVKKYGLGVQAMSWSGVSEKKKQRIGADMARLAKKLSNFKAPHVPVGMKLMFDMMRMMQKANMGSGPVERKYWEDKGWLGKGRPWKQI